MYNENVVAVLKELLNDLILNLEGNDCVEKIDAVKRTHLLLEYLQRNRIDDSTDPIEYGVSVLDHFYHWETHITDTSLYRIVGESEGIRLWNNYKNHKYDFSVVWKWLAPSQKDALVKIVMEADIDD